MCAYCYEDSEGKYRYEVPEGKTEKTVYFKPLKGRPHGSYGGIYKIVTRESKEYALKAFGQGDEGQAKECRDAEAEILQMLDGADGHAPKLYSQGTFFERKGGNGCSCGFPAFLMEFVPGDTLENAIKNGVFTSGEFHLDGRRTLEVMEKVCEAVAACHSPSDREGSVHCNLKPSNIMIEASDGSVSRVAIVGWSKATLCSNSYTSASQETVAYAAPELLRAAYKKNGRGKASAFGLPTVDVWSLGAIAYFVRTGKDPSLSDDPSDQTEKSLAEYADYREQHPINLPDCNDNYDEYLNEFICRCTENDHKKRFQSADEAREFIAAYWHREAEAEEKPSQGAIPGKPQFLLLEDTPAPTPRAKRKTKKRIVAVLAAAAIAIAVVGIAIASGLGLFDTLDTGVSDVTLTTSVEDDVTPKASVEDYSWAELAAISDAIAQAEDEDAALEVAKRYNLVNDDGTLDGTQTKSVTLTDGTETSVQIVGFAHDDKSDGSGKAGITFIFTDAIALHAMNSEESSDGGWEASEARSWLSSDGKSLLPEELQDVLVAVDKYTNNVGETEDVSSVTSTSDELWLFSHIELAGALSDSDDESAVVYNGEGSQYKLFSDQQISQNSPNDLLVKVYSGEAERWFMRSPAIGFSGMFDCVGLDGNPSSLAGDADKSLAVVPGFCIGSTAGWTWGDNEDGRQTYTIEEINNGALGSLITFNSISDSPGVGGDERSFTGVRLADDTSRLWTSSIKAIDGETYVIRAYVHNNSPNGYDAIAEDTTVSFDIAQGIGTKVQVQGVIESSNASPSQYFSSVYFNSDVAFHLEYVEGSALLENNGIGANGGISLDDEIVADGVLIGYDDLDGRVPGCFQYDNYVTIEVKVVYDYTYSVDTTARKVGSSEWLDTVDAAIGDEIEFQISYQNWETSMVSDVMVRDVLPDGFEYLEGTTVVYNSTYPSGFIVDDGAALFSTGINIGSYGNEANAFIRFRVRVVDVGLGYGKNTLANWGQVGTGSTVVQDSVVITVLKSDDGQDSDGIVSKHTRTSSEEA